jgi:hypothetical protein
MALDAEKIDPRIEHHEDVKLGGTEFVRLAEEAHYGPSGVKAFFSSPFVFGAAMLASMGGFSYGYGLLVCH